ncbi:hypothetical protein EV360DRAFT_85775 [Lentinula raphanica]|nr:hypothetical protein EV360DRAFT_85775 [Lentinula raphanica]
MGNQANARRKTSGKRKSRQPVSSTHEHEDQNSSSSTSAVLSPPTTRPAPKPYHRGIPAYDRVHPAGHSLEAIDEDDTTAAAALMSLSNAAGVFQQATPVRSHATAAATSSVHHSRKAQTHSMPVPQPTIRYRAPNSPTLDTISILNSDDDVSFMDAIQTHGNADLDNEHYSNDHSTVYSQMKRKPTKAMDSSSESEGDNAICSEDDNEDPWKAHVKSVRQFKIPFEVPYRSSKRNLSTITSHTNFNTFMNELAAAMDTRVSLLRNISYLPSYKPKAKVHEGPNDILLECEQDWINLIQGVEGYLDSRTARQQKQSWSITILDKTPVDKAPVKDVSKPMKNASSAAAGSEQVASMSDAALLVSLRAETRCSACQAPCYVLSSGDHYQYTDRDLNLWVDLASKHKAVIDKNNPPAEILRTLGENLSRQNRRTTSTAVPMTPAPVQYIPAPAPPSAAPDITTRMQEMVMVMGTVAPLMQTMMQSLNPQNSSSNTSHASNSSKRPRSDSSVAPTSSPAGSPQKSKAASSNKKNLELCDWLPQIDMDPERSKRGGNYGQYTDVLRERGLFDVEDLSGLKEETLSQLTGMEYGYAQRLIRWAKEDLGLIKRPRFS